MMNKAQIKKAYKEGWLEEVAKDLVRYGTITKDHSFEIASGYHAALSWIQQSRQAGAVKMCNFLFITGYMENAICAHCGRTLKHGIKISTGEVVGADCFDKQMTKPRVSGKKKYRFGAAHIIHIAKVVEYKAPSQWELYNVSQSATKFEAV